MSTHIIINGKEVNNPVSKAGILVGAVLISSLVAAITIFVLLPLVGVAVTLSVGFITIFVIAAVMGFVGVLLSTALFGWLFGSTELRFIKSRRKI
ncbi:MAG: hypothetical protein OEX07_10765 [Gammaproteobacteria bacterium]|nr:hypothetical protein [Gammaproteobacteria bacterium]